MAIKLDLKTLIILCVVAVLGLSMAGYNIIPGLNLNVQPTTPSTLPSTSSTGAAYAKAFDIEFDLQELDSITGAANTGTSSSYKVFHSGGIPLAQRTSLYSTPPMQVLSTTATSTGILPGDNYKLYISAYSGTAEYTDPEATLKANPFLTSYKWMEVDTQGINRPVFEMDITKAGTVPTEPVQFTPAMRVMVTAMLIDEDESPTVTGAAAADQASLGIVANTKVYITWKVIGITAGDAAAFDTLYVVGNQTSSKMSVDKCWVGGGNAPLYLGSSSGVAVKDGGLYRWNAPTRIDRTSGIEQYWWFHGQDSTRQLADAIIVPNPSNSAGYTEVKIEITATFAYVGDGETLTLTIDPLNSDNVRGTQISDAVMLTG